MKPNLKWMLGILLLTLFACKGSGSFYNGNISQETICEEKGGYWYKGKCWNDFEEEGYTVEEIDEVVEREMALINKAQVMLNQEAYPIHFFFPEMDGKEIILLTVFTDGDKSKSIIQPTNKKQVSKGSFSSSAILLEGNIIKLSEEEAAMNAAISNPLATGVMEVKVNDLDKFDLSFRGELSNESSGKSYKISYQTHEAILGAGTSSLELKGNEFHINGELGTRTYHQLKQAIKDHPQVKTVVLGKVNGSVNDAVNMHTGRILREAGLHTKVLSTSSIASGGVDLFCAGKERIIENGAQLGIHSWCCVGDYTAIDLPQDHPAHQYQIAYFTMCMGAELGPAFYFHTLEAAPFDGVHYMTEEELKKWKIATN